MTNRNEFAEKIAAYLHQRLLVIETVVAIIVLISIGLRANNVSSGGAILTVVLSALALVYFFTAYHIDLSVTTAMEMFVNKLTAYALSTATIGLLFFIQSWPSPKSMILVSSSILVFVFIYGLIKTKNTKTIIRSAIFLILASCIYFIPREKFEELHIITIQPIDSVSVANR